MRISDCSSDVCSSDLKNAIIPVDAAIQANLKETVTRVLASLTPREERVLRTRFGIGMNTDHTLEEVGQQFSVTRERIHQIEAKALRKLKHPSRSRKLRSFLDTYPNQIGRASCWERVCQYVSISVVSVSLKKKKTQQNYNTK